MESTIRAGQALQDALDGALHTYHPKSDAYTRLSWEQVAVAGMLAQLIDGEALTYGLSAQGIEEEWGSALFREQAPLAQQLARFRADYNLQKERQSKTGVVL